MLRKLFFLAIVALAPALHAQDQSQFWPEVDTYVNLTSRTRLFLNDSLSSDQDTRDLQGEFGANIDVFLKPAFSWFDFITSYGILPVFLMLYLGHKLVKKTRVVPLSECNFDPGAE